MLVALTGGTGLLGRATLAALLSSGHEVRALVRPGRPHPTCDGVTWVEGDLDDASSLDVLVAGTDAIVHLAYSPLEAPPPAGRSPGEQLVQGNLGGTVRLIERATGTTHRQLVYASSLAVYGTAAHHAPAARRMALDEDFPVWPGEFYAAHKAALEKLIVAGSGALGLNASAFRIGCLIGVDRDPDRGPLAGVVREAATTGVIANRVGAHVIAVEDMAAILVAALGNEAARGLVCNAFDRWLDFADLAPLIAERLGRDVRVECAPAPEPQPPILRERLAPLAPATWHTDAALRDAITALATR